jgi:hypothetical protein
MNLTPLARSSALSLTMLISSFSDADDIETKCSAGVVPVQGPLGYRVVDGRCEGSFLVPVSSALVALSLTEGSLPSDATRNDTLSLEYDAPVSGSVRIEARVLRPNVHYRMDVDLGRRRLFDWPLGKLKEAGFAGATIGLRGVAAASLGRDALEVLVPVRVRQSGAASPSAARDSYHLLLSSSDEIWKVWASLYDQCGAPLEIWKDKELLARRYPAGVPLSLEVPRSTCGPGRYRLTVKAKGRAVVSVLSLELVHD